MTSFARIGLLAVVLAPACDWGPQYCEGDWAAASPEDAPPIAESRVVAQVNAMTSRAVDILFVIDDSSSMMDQQRQLGIWSSEMFDVLGSSGDLPDLHIGVVSSSIQVAGLAGCSSGTGAFHTGSAVLKTNPYIVDVAGPEGRVRNYTGTLTETFAKMALVGDEGCGFEQPFKAAHVALTNKASGFLRDDALLLVVFVTDEDDCSATSSLIYSDPYADACSDVGPITSYRCFEHGVVCYDGKGSRVFGDRKNCRSDESGVYVEPVTQFADFLKRTKNDPGQVIVAGIFGKPNHISAIPDERVTTFQTPRLASVCSGTSASKEGVGATPAVRMNTLMAQFGGRASQSSICEPELSWAMHDVGLVTRDVAARSHCMRGSLRDADASMAGIQPACRVEITSQTGEKRTEVPPCRSTDDTRCFTIVPDAGECAETETQLAFRVRGGADNEALTVHCDIDDDAALAPSTNEATL